MRKNRAFEWTNKSEMAFQQLKDYLGSPLLLTVANINEELLVYLSVSPTVVSTVLVKEDDKFRSKYTTSVKFS